MSDQENVAEPMVDYGGDRNIFVNRKVRAKKAAKSVGKWCFNNLLLVLTVIGVFLGVVFGFAARTAEPSADTIMMVSFPGDMLMRMLKMLILPLIVSSMITGLASLDANSSGRMGLYAVVYYFATTFSAIILGIILVVSIHPGTFTIMDNKTDLVDEHPVSSLDAFLDLIRNIFPENIMQSCFQHSKTVFKKKFNKPDKDMNSTDISNLTTVATTMATTTISNISDMMESAKLNFTWIRTYPSIDGINVLGLIVFCTVFGIMLSKMGERGKIMVDFFAVLNEIIMKMVLLVMWYSPLGIMFLIIGKILSLENPAELGERLGMYMVTVLAGLIIHAVIILPSIYFAITRKNPLRLFIGILQAWVTALGTASSSATLPVTFRCLEENLNIDRRVTRFVLPIGATINMDGTALYEAVAPIFIAQMNGIDLNFGQIITISLTATCASIGAAAIPSAGLVTMVMVLTSVGLPADDVSLILAVDWFLDRIRTSINVLGDSFGAGVIAHLCRHQLEQDLHAPIDDKGIEMTDNLDDIKRHSKASQGNGDTTHDD